MKLGPAHAPGPPFRYVHRVAAAILPLLLVPALAAAQGEIFANGFEVGQVCSWSSVSAPCVTETAVAGALTGEALPVCVPRTSGSSWPFDYTLCPTQVCADGITPGCQATFHIVTATPDFAGPMVATDLAGDDADLPFLITSQLGGSDTCTLQLRQGTGTSNVPLGVATCFPGYLFGENAGPATTAVTATMSIPETTTLCSAAATLLPSVQSQILAEMATGAGIVVTGAVSDVTVGRFLCAP